MPKYFNFELAFVNFNAGTVLGKGIRVLCLGQSQPSLCNLNG